MPPLPECMVGAWRIFLELTGGRTMHAAGPNPITWTDIDAYCRQSGASLASWELAAIRAADAAFLSAMTDRQGS